MPLTKCPACGAEVSTKAQECYRCGTRLHSRGRVLTGAIVLIIVVAALWFIVPPEDEDEIQPSVTAPSVSATPDFGAVAEPHALSVTGDRVNLREGPSLQDRVILQLSKGHAVTEIQRRGGWVEVRDEDDNIGWISAEFVSD